MSLAHDMSDLSGGVKLRMKSEGIPANRREDELEPLRLETTHDATQARLTVQRKIVSTLRAMWLTRTPYCEENAT